MTSSAIACAGSVFAPPPATMQVAVNSGRKRWSSMNASELLHRFRDLQAYVGWTAADGVRVQLVAKLIAQRIQGLIDDFYAEIERHPDAARIITGGDEQIRRLKASLRTWLLESLECHSDAEYLARRWSIGLRHAEIGLNPAYTSVAVARLRN